MTLKPYPAHEDSGIEWVGRIPLGWEVQPFFAAVRVRREKNASLTEDNLLSLSYGNIVRKDMNSNDGLLPESFATYQIVHPFDMVFRLTDLQNDKRSLRSALVQETGIITSAYLAVKPLHHHPRYFAYLMREYDAQKVFYSMGGGLRQSMKFDDVKHLPVVMPPRAEQEQIANYLDNHTGKIDAIIGKQQQLIETLAERRQAVISHAVTKGLDPDAPMKTSGVSWLGEVPSNWVVQRLQYITDVLTGFPFKSDDYSSDENDIRLLRGINVSPGRLAWGEVAYWPRAEADAYSDYHLHEDDLILGLDRPIVSAGTRVARVQSEDLPALLLQRVARIRPRRGTSACFIEYLLSGPEFRDYLAPIFTGVSVPHMSPDQLDNFQVALPTADEQAEIVTYLDRETSQIDGLSAKAREMIVVLKERRQALISAAVTGKIDVRGLS
ncbi:type I restriction enzyme S subunit [Rhodoglobus vestalii]|uniref:Type I restriction enzyme S subunit n=1 Tax=Rhodoglobus vestalii TaxID=193384 RepID=A0A8H2K2H8_9MICO|nr:restriction endonuclease subunit S [Rhodoglobus vestalii]TQO18508.1 type I restriction enzyme S subunit [Rhodoglobus vestalii]